MYMYYNILVGLNCLKVAIIIIDLPRLYKASITVGVHWPLQGYVSRGTALPPLDPYVEHDPPTLTHPPPPSQAPPTHPHTPQVSPQRNNSSRYGNQLLARSTNDTDPHSAPASMEQRPTTPNNNVDTTKDTKSAANVYPDATYPAKPRNQRQPPPGYIMQNGGVVPPYKPGRVEVDGRGPVTMECIDTETSPIINLVNKPAVDRKNMKVVPPLQTKGRFKCPRCARRFLNNADCNDHKTRCIS